MGAKYTASQAKASLNYMKDKHQIRVIVSKDDALRYKEAAFSKGFSSLNKFIIDCIEKNL